VSMSLIVDKLLPERARSSISFIMRWFWFGVAAGV
jgi:hypothetical protein